MRGFLAAVHQVGHGLIYIQPLSPTDPGFGVGGPPVDPGYGRPEWGDRPDQGLPGFGHPDNTLPGFGHPDAGLPGYGHPGNRPPGSYPGRPDAGLPVPPPSGIVTPPIVLPERPRLPEGAGVVVPFPEGASVPAPTYPTQPGSKPYILWFGPGTQSSVIWALPPADTAAPK